MVYILVLFFFFPGLFVLPDLTAAFFSSQPIVFLQQTFPGAQTLVPGWSRPTDGPPIPGQPGDLHGWVVDLLTGQPIAGAVVETAGHQVTTDQAGRFHFSLAPGFYDLHATAPTYIGMTLLRQPAGQPDTPPLLFEMVPAQLTSAQETQILRKMRSQHALADAGASSPPAISFQAPVEALPRTIRVWMPEGEIVTLDMEEYVRGVLPMEIGPHRPFEALKAQAVAARTYAATRCLPETAGDPAQCEPGLDANVDTTVRTQVYDPIRRYDTTDQAVQATYGTAVTYAGRLIEALFFAHSDGQTRNSEDVFSSYKPYLRSVPDPAPFDVIHGHGVGLSQLGASVLADWDATYEEILRYFYQGAEVQPPQPPTLFAPAVVPAHPDSRTPVRFEVTYADPEGDMPAFADVYVDGRAYPMPEWTGDLRTGARFAYTTTLEAGTHTYNFYFSDGMAETVVLEGGVVNVPPSGQPARLPPVAHSQGRRGYWRYASRLDWLTGETDGLEIRGAEDGFLHMSEIRETAIYTSAVLPADFPFLAIGANWQVDLPAGATFELQVQVSTDGTTWSQWVTMPPAAGGRWRPATNWSDLLFLEGAFLRFRLHLSAGPTEEARPTVDGLTWIYIDAPAGPAPLASHTEPAVISRETWCPDCPISQAWPAEYRIPRKFILYPIMVPPYVDGYQAMRALYQFYALARGWGDIGYNYLIDHQGRVFEGRAGLEQIPGQVVVGGHALQYSYGSVGVAFLLACDEGGTAAMTQGLTDFLVSQGLTYNIGPYDGGPLAGVSFPAGILGYHEVLAGVTGCGREWLADVLPALRQQVDKAMQAHTGDPTSTPTPALSPGCQALLVNGGFEQGAVGWELNRAYLRQVAHSGSQALFIGLLDTEPDREAFASAQQTVSIPTGMTAFELSFWFDVMAPGDDGDRFLLRLFDAEGRMLFSRALPVTPAGWQVMQLDVSRELANRAGQEVRLYFGVINNGLTEGQKAGLQLDDVALTGCRGMEMPTPTRPATSTPTVTLTPGVSPTPPAVATPGPPLEQVCTDLTVNPGFESDLDGWVVPPAAWPARLTTEPVHGGRHAVRLGPADPGANPLGYSAIWQDVRIPADALEIEFSYWSYPVAQDPADRQIVEIREPNQEPRLPMPEYAGAPSDAQSWVFFRHTVSPAYAGRTLRLYFGVLDRQLSDQSAGVTLLYVDDVALTVCRPKGQVARIYLPYVRR